MKSLLELYGQQFRNPMPNSDSEDYTTADVFGQMGANKRRAEYDNSLLGMVHNWATGEQRQPVQLPDNAPLMDQMKEAGMRMLNLPNDMAAGGAKTMAHWLGSAGNPEMVEPLDMLAPLGIGAMAGLAGAAPRGAVGSAGGKLVKTVDHAANAIDRNIDHLGYYSGALESAKNLKQAKGTPEQMLAQLKAGGAKQAELDATNFGAFLDGKNSITRDEIVSFLDKNRVGVKEVERRSDRPVPLDLEALENVTQMYHGYGYRDASQETQRLMRQELGMEDLSETKWSAHSLDPSNPTYMETVLHLPGTERRPGSQRWSDNDFQSGHFPEPNIVGHMMTSMTKHEGRPVFTIDQIQSDWGQKLRDGGVRDEKKIAELKAKIAPLEAARIEAQKAVNLAYDKVKASNKNNPDSNSWDWTEYTEAKSRAVSRELSLLEAELRTAEATPPGHPLVNTTDQWTNTTLRRALRQAAEADAEYVAVPSGKTVLSYNPGDTHGMEGFYNGIVPKNLGNILKKLDHSTQYSRVDKLDTPSNGMAGDGFSLFSLTPEVREKIKRDGLPLFADQSSASLPGLAANALDMSHEARMARAKEMGFDTDTTWFHGTNGVFDEFSTEGRVGRPWAKGAVFFSDSPKTASGYAKSSAFADNIGKLIAEGGDTTKALVGGVDWLNQGSSIIPAKVNYGKQKTIRVGPEDNTDVVAGLIRDAKSEGYDTVRLVNNNDADPVGWGADGMPIFPDEMVVFDPSRIRSPNADFDPAKADSANLLAADQARGSIPGLLAGAADEPTQDDELMRLLKLYGMMP